MLAANASTILTDFALVMGVGAVISIVCQKLRLPVVVGYLLAGLIIGPYVPLPLVANLDNVHTLSEMGIILLFFSLGTEFSLKRLTRAGPSAALVAIIKGGFMTWMGFLGGRVLGWTPMESLFAGAALAISSTMIIARVFKHLQVGGPLAELVLSSLIVEDLLAILLLTLLTAVATGSGLDAATFLLTVGRLLGFLAVVLALGHWVLPRLLRWVADTTQDEVLLVTVMGLCFAYSMLAARAGYSVALGAFLGGTIVAESGRERKIEALLLPLKDVFVAVFFVSIGMQIDPAQLAPNWVALLLLGVLVVVGKFTSAAAGALLGGSSLRTSLRTGASLAQIGEFSFIIAALGQKLGVVGPALFPVLAATCAWTTFTTPLLIQHSDRLADWIEQRLPRRFRHLLMHHRVAMARLKDLPFRKAAWHHLRRPFLYLLLDAVLFGLVVLLGALAQESLAAVLEQGGLSHRVAGSSVWVLVGMLALWLSLRSRRQVRILAMAVAERALPVAGQAEPGVADAIRLFLELGLGAMVALPLMAVLQPLLPWHFTALLGLLGVFLFGAGIWRRVGFWPLGKQRALPGKRGDAGAEARLEKLEN